MAATAAAPRVAVPGAPIATQTATAPHVQVAIPTATTSVWRPKRAQVRHVPTTATARVGTARSVTVPKHVYFNVRTPPLRPCNQKKGFLVSLSSASNGKNISNSTLVPSFTSCVLASSTFCVYRAIVAAAGTRETATTARRTDPATGAARGILCPAGVATRPRQVRPPAPVAGAPLATTRTEGTRATHRFTRGATRVHRTAHTTHPGSYADRQLVQSLGWYSEFWPLPQSRSLSASSSKNAARNSTTYRVRLATNFPRQRPSVWLLCHRFIRPSLGKTRSLLPGWWLRRSSRFRPPVRIHVCG